MDLVLTLDNNMPDEVLATTFNDLLVANPTLVGTVPIAGDEETLTPIGTAPEAKITVEKYTQTDIAQVYALGGFVPDPADLAAITAALDTGD